MEALALGGVPTVLFLDIPDAAMLARFADCRAVGLAGTSRSETPQWMDDHLAPAFDWLEASARRSATTRSARPSIRARTIGNIGRAIEIGRRVFGQARVPLIVGAPQLRRYTAFGDLFAAYRGVNYRIDRHPVMSRHPVTPMHEADLLVHLSHQTALTPALLDLADLGAPTSRRGRIGSQPKRTCCSSTWRTGRRSGAPAASYGG